MQSHTAIATQWRGATNLSLVFTFWINSFACTQLISVTSAHCSPHSQQCSAGQYEGSQCRACSRGPPLATDTTPIVNAELHDACESGGASTGASGVAVLVRLLMGEVVAVLIIPSDAEP
jgi:hypothetical protein